MGESYPILIVEQRINSEVQIIVLLKPTNNPQGGRSNPEVVGSISTEVKRFFLCLVWFPVSLY